MKASKYGLSKDGLYVTEVPHYQLYYFIRIFDDGFLAMGRDSTKENLWYHYGLLCEGNEDVWRGKYEIANEKIKFVAACRGEVTMGEGVIASGSIRMHKLETRHNNRSNAQYDTCFSYVNIVDQQIDDNLSDLRVIDDTTTCFDFLNHHFIKISTPTFRSIEERAWLMTPGLTLKDAIRGGSDTLKCWFASCIGVMTNEEMRGLAVWCAIDLIERNPTMVVPRSIEEYLSTLQHGASSLGDENIMYISSSVLAFAEAHNKDLPSLKILYAIPSMIMYECTKRGLECKMRADSEGIGVRAKTAHALDLGLTLNLRDIIKWYCSQRLRLSMGVYDPDKEIKDSQMTWGKDGVSAFDAAYRSVAEWIYKNTTFGKLI